jgi:hypothetical protein
MGTIEYDGGEKNSEREREMRLRCLFSEAWDMAVVPELENSHESRGLT